MVCSNCKKEIADQDPANEGAGVQVRVCPECGKTLKQPSLVMKFGPAFIAVGALIIFAGFIGPWVSF